MFETTGPHYCSVCPATLNKKGRRIDEPLRLSRSNYSGYGVDIAVCPSCNKTFQISYKVDQIIEVPLEKR
mgnify:FL=1